MEGPVWWDGYNEEYIIHVAQSLGFSEIHTVKGFLFTGAKL